MKALKLGPFKGFNIYRIASTHVISYVPDHLFSCLPLRVRVILLASNLRKPVDLKIQIGPHVLFMILLAYVILVLVQVQIFM